MILIIIIKTPFQGEDTLLQHPHGRWEWGGDVSASPGERQMKCQEQIAWEGIS